MRIFWLLILIQTSAFSGIGQMTGMGGGGRQGGFGNGQAANIGHFYGRILDAKTDKGMDGVSVQLIQSKFDTVTRKRKDTVIAGMITGRKGDFSLENLPIFGNFRLKITAIGYQAYDQKVAFEMKAGKSGDMQSALNGVDRDLGNIKLAADAQTLAQVTVTASKPLIQMGVDRKIYNVEKDISAQGGTGVDVMKNVPSVQVDIDGNVTLRNSTPTIFVDGRPSTLTLDQIPADAIQSVEIITNPGAKFDASGGASGILNIVLKKNRKAGYNGNIRAGVDKRGRYNLGGDINVKQGKINVFANANYGQRKSISPGTTDRNTFFQSPFNTLHQYDNNVNKGYFAFGRFGLDYLIDNRNTLSASGTIVHGSFNPYTNSDLYVDTLYPSGTLSSYTQRAATTDAQFNNHGGMLSFKHTFPKAGQEWTGDVNYSKGTNSNKNYVNSNIFNEKDGPLSSIYNQQQIGSGTNENITGQTDFVKPINDKSKFETGARIAIRNVTSINDINTLGNDGQYHNQPLLSSRYKYRDRVYAGYVTYSNAIKDFGYQLGLRAESSDYNGSQNFSVKAPVGGGLNDTIGNFSNKFPLSFFPSVFLSQKLEGDQDLSLNYTRRIDRPSFFQLFPFTDYSDSLNLSRGNPDLKPQFTNSFEISYAKTYAGNSSFLASVYYKYTTDLITRYQFTGQNPINDSIVIISSFINARSSYVGGLELIGRNSITKWWDITSSVNIFTSKINIADTSIHTADQTYSWFGKINNTFKLPKNFTLQLTGDYTSKTVLPPGGSASSGGGGGGGRGFNQTVSGSAQGYSKPSGGVDAALKYEFLKNKAASLTLSVSDIFRSRVSDVYTSSNYFNQETTRRRDPQFFRLQFNYRFGKFDVALFKRKNLKGEMESIQGAQGGQGQN
ncbi:outer membrane beta-barrel protein [Flavitalea flava]